MYEQSVLDNITNLRVFNDDQQTLHFMANGDVFKDVAIDDDEHEHSLQAEAGNRKGHLITKGVVTLEHIFDLQEHFQGSRNNKTHSSTMMHELINLGIEQDMTFVNLGTCCTQQERQAFVFLFK